MRARLAASAAVLSLAAACARDASLPPPPGPGTIQGRAVYAVPGQAQRVPASGARVTVLSTSLGAIADPDGRFVVAGVDRTDGLLLVQADLDADGTPDRQTLIGLAAIHAGPGRDVFLDDVVVVENARVRGRALRADLPTRGGHGGTAVFVPEGPFLTQTGDDGSYLLADMPEGRITLTFFHDGYDPVAIDGIALRAGEDFTAREVSLLASSGPGAGAPGAISGTVSFSPSAADASAASVSVVPVAGDVLSAHPTADGRFAFPSVPVGLYRVEAAATGYTTAVVANVLVNAGQETRLALQLAPGGVSVTPPPSDPPPSCVAGTRCDLPFPCKVGQVNCATGSPVCVEAGNAIDGISCATNRVCSAGECVVVCAAGASCSPANPCHGGTVSCATGTPTCADTGAVLADGTACGSGQVCLAGACTACAAGASCVAANPCHAGLTSCATGVSTCVDTGMALQDGASCGSNLACQGGVCGACTPGKACTPAGYPCHAGQTSCATGREVCIDLGTALADGASCGTNLVCGGGSCVACEAGASCAPPNPCHTGSIACGSGAPVCVDQGASLAAGTPCGTDRVCASGGTCVACASGVACAAANPCHAGATSCSTGVSVCADTGAALANGTACGTNLVCNGGACTACTANVVCTPANPCHSGLTSCSTGTATCADSGVQLVDGASCGTNQVCRAGACGACVGAAACDSAAGHAPPPATPDPCKNYATACGSGLPVCGVVSNETDGTACGGGNVCRSGVCSVPGNQLVLLTAPAAMHALPNQPLSVTLQLTDVGGAPITTPDTVTLAAPPGAQVPAPAATSAADGTVSFAITLGRSVGAQTFRATAPTAFAPLDLVATADAPADGTLIPIANASHVYGYSYASGPAPALPVYLTLGVAVASDGTLYFTDHYPCVVKRVSPSGVLTVIAGIGSCTFNGESGPAASIALAYPYGLALDEARGKLYVADQYNHRIRELDLATGWIATVSGDGTVPGTDPYGDGGPALNAQLYYPEQVALGPETPPALYAADTYHGRIRRVDPTTHVITTPIAEAACTSTGPLVLNGLTFGTGSGSMAFDEAGRMFVSGRFCGKETAGAAVSGVVRVETGGTLRLVAGAVTGVVASGVPATSVRFADDPAIALDRAPRAGGGTRSNLFVSVPAGNFVARVDGATGRFDLVLGTGVAGTGGDFGPATAATRSRPAGIAFRPGTRDLYVAEGNTYSVGMVAGAGSVAASSASLEALSAAATAYPSQQLPAPLNVRLRDGAGTALAGYPVTFATDPAGLPGGWIGATSAITAGDGVAGVAARPGFAPGRHGVVASYRDLHGEHVTGSPIVLDVTAVAPPVRTVFAAVNQAHLSGSAGVPGPGAVAQLYLPRGVAAASDGTVYFSDASYHVYRMAPSGLVSVLAGTGSWTGIADGGPATASGMEPFGLSLDEAGGQLFFADQSNHRVRRIDLATATVHAVAGGGATNADGVATETSIYYPSRVAFAGALLYLSDRTGGADRLRRVDVGAGTIETFLRDQTPAALPQTPPQVATCIGDGPLVFWGCSSEPGCSVAEAPDGSLYVSGSFCGLGTVEPPSASGISPVPGIARVDMAGPTAGNLALVAGRRPNGLFDGFAGQVTGFDAPPALATDAAGNLWITNRGNAVTEQKVGYFEASAGVAGPSSLFRMIGRGPVGVEYVDESQTSFANPVDVACGAHVYVTDGAYSTNVSYAVRVIW